MKANRVGIPFVAICCSLSCAHASKGASGPSPEDYFPLAVDSEWTYSIDGPAASSPGAAAQSTRTVRILSRSADGYFHDNQRGELKSDGQCLQDRQRRLLCAPFEVGKGWLSVVSVSSTERYEIVEAGAITDTPAGRFDNALKVRAHNRAGPDVELVQEVTYARGVGIVRVETFAVIKGEAKPQLRMELKSFKLAGAAK